jgi:RNA polymerase sigma factor (sigma-70 family)
MASQNSQAPVASSNQDDIDPELLHKTQAYLDCLRSRRSPPWHSITAWHKFYGVYDPLIRRLAVACGARAVDLDDCVQEVWIALVTRLGGFCPDSHRGRFRSWLYCLVQSKAADLVRRRTRHPLDRLTPELEIALFGSACDPAPEYELQRRRVLVHRVLDALRQKVPARSYRVFYMHWMEGRTIPEIAATLDLTPEQVWTLDHRTKQKFRCLVKMQHKEWSFLEG